MKAMISCGRREEYRDNLGRRLELRRWRVKY